MYTNTVDGANNVRNVVRNFPKLVNSFLTFMTGNILQYFVDLRGVVGFIITMLHSLLVSGTQCEL